MSPKRLGDPTGWALTLVGTLGSAALYGLAFPPLATRVLAPVCLIPFLLLLRNSSRRRALLIVVAWSVPASYAVGDAMPASMAAYFDRPWWFGWLVLVTVAWVSLAPFYAAFALAHPAIARRTGPRWRPLAVAAAWCAAELGRGRLYSGSEVSVGNPWSLMGYTQVGFETALQIASVTGIYGVSFLVVATNAALAELLVVRRRPADRREALMALLVVGALWVGSLLYGTVVLAGAPPLEDREGHRRVVLVQPRLDLGARWRPEFYGRNLETYIDLTRAAVASADPELVVWPESAMTFLLEREPEFQASLRELLRETGLELVAGGPGIVPGDPPRYTNSVFLMSPAGRARARYDKEHLLPISEFIPLRRVDLLEQRFEGIERFVHGTRTAPLPSRLGALGILICNEGMLGEVAAERVRDGAELLVSPANDSWLGRARWGRMMFDQTSVRAIEQRRYLIRASDSGPSGIVDPWGRIRARSEPESRAVVVGWVKPLKGLSVYARIGDAFALGCLALTVLLLATRPRSSSAPPRPPEP